MIIEDPSPLVERFMLHHKKKISIILKTIILSCNRLTSTTHTMHAYFREVMTYRFTRGNIKNIPHFLVVTPVGNANNNRRERTLSAPRANSIFNYAILS